MADTSSDFPIPQARRRRRYRRRGSATRQRRLTARFTDDEMNLIQEAADVADLTIAGFCGTAAVAAARRTNAGYSEGNPDSDPTDDELAEMQRELYAARVAVNRAGTNLNQAVAELNTTGTPPVWLEHAVARAMAAMEQVDAISSRIHRRLS
jgi:hypothetical protein